MRPQPPGETAPSAAQPTPTAAAPLPALTDAGTAVLRAPPATLARLLRDLRAGLPVAPAAFPLPGPLHAVLRRDGRRLRELWIDTGSLAGAFGQLLALPEAAEADALELCLTHDWRAVAPPAFARVFPNTARGHLGLAVTLGGQRHRLSPLAAVASNRGFRRWLAQKLSPAGAAHDGRLPPDARLEAFAARQVILSPLTKPDATELSRGCRPVPAAGFDRAELERLIAGMIGWLSANLRADGHLTYKYWPSRGRESEADNTIRRFMGTLALIRAATARGDTALMTRAAANLQFNLDRFYRREGELGLITWEGKAKLGAIALAALAILEHPEGARWAEVYRALVASVARLHQPDGSFRSFLTPPERNDNQNFYPGEALLFWAQRLRGDPLVPPDATLETRFLASFAYYRAWHRSARNPAFVPWHSQAYALAYERLGRPELRDFVLEMNDWLLPLQQWETAPAPLFQGRFYDPARPDYGPPHASSTGVYLEGLAAALALARRPGGDSGGDAARAALYERAIWRAARNLRQLQFKDERDAFYVARRARVLGGLRTEVYNNEIRVDNVQHGLMGLLSAGDLLRHDSLHEAEAACPSGLSGG